MASPRSGLRMTVPTQLVLQAFLKEPEKQLYGLEICAIAGLQTGTIHPILARLEKIGWLHSTWEEIDPKQVGRPRRRYYRLDPNSIASVHAALRRAQEATPGPRKPVPHPSPGFAGGAPWP